MNIEKANYLEAELFRVANLPLTGENFPYGFDIQIKSTKGSTKWLRITPQQMKQIEDVLFELETV